jgi:hypothetical protein
MNALEFGTWRRMAEAPRDGARVIVALRSTEQGPAEVDVARWAKPPRADYHCWIASDSDKDCTIAYDENELLCWMPLPSSSEGLRFSISAAALPEIPPDMEMGGSGI